MENKKNKMKKVDPHRVLAIKFSSTPLLDELLDQMSSAEVQALGLVARLRQKVSALKRMRKRESETGCADFDDSFILQGSQGSVTVRAEVEEELIIDPLLKEEDQNAETDNEGDLYKTEDEEDKADGNEIETNEEEAAGEEGNKEDIKEESNGEEKNTEGEIKIKENEKHTEENIKTEEVKETEVVVEKQKLEDTKAEEMMKKAEEIEKKVEEKEEGNKNTVEEKEKGNKNNVEEKIKDDMVEQENTKAEDGEKNAGEGKKVPESENEKADGIEENNSSDENKTDCATNVNESGERKNDNGVQETDREKNKVDREDNKINEGLKKPESDQSKIDNGEIKKNDGGNKSADTNKKPDSGDRKTSAEPKKVESATPAGSERRPESAQKKDVNEKKENVEEKKVNSQVKKTNVITKKEESTEKKADVGTKKVEIQEKKTEGIAKKVDNKGNNSKVGTKTEDSGQKKSGDQIAKKDNEQKKEVAGIKNTGEKKAVIAEKKVNSAVNKIVAGNKKPNSAEKKSDGQTKKTENAPVKKTVEKKAEGEKLESKSKEAKSDVTKKDVEAKRAEGYEKKTPGESPTKADGGPDGKAPEKAEGKGMGEVKCPAQDGGSAEEPKAGAVDELATRSSIRIVESVARHLPGRLGTRMPEAAVECLLRAAERGAELTGSALKALRAAEKQLIDEEKSAGPWARVKACSGKGRARAARVESACRCVEEALREVTRCFRAYDALESTLPELDEIAFVHAHPVASLSYGSRHRHHRRSALHASRRHRKGMEIQLSPRSYSPQSLVAAGTDSDQGSLLGGSSSTRVSFHLYEVPVLKVPRILAEPGKRLRSGGESNTSNETPESNKKEDGACSSSSSTSSSDGNNEYKDIKRAVLLVARLLQQALVKCFPNVRKISLSEGPPAAHGSTAGEQKFKPSQKLLNEIIKVLNERPSANDDDDNNNKKDDNKSFKEVEAVLVLKRKKNKDSSKIKKENVKKSAKAAAISQEISDKTKDGKDKKKTDKSKDKPNSQNIGREGKISKDIHFEKDDKKIKSKVKMETTMIEAGQSKRNKVSEIIDKDNIVSMMQKYAKEMNNLCEVFTENTGKMRHDTTRISKDNASGVVNNGEIDEECGRREEEEMDDMWQVLVNMADMETYNMQYGRPMDRHAQEMLTIWENVDTQDSQHILNEGQYFKEDSTIWQLGPDRGGATNMASEKIKDHLFVDGSSLWKYIIENADEETYQKLKQANAELHGRDVDKGRSQSQVNDREMPNKPIRSHALKRGDQSTSVLTALVENVNMEEAYHSLRKLKSKTNALSLQVVDSPANVGSVEAKAIAAAIWQDMAEKANGIKDKSDNATDKNNLLYNVKRSVSDTKPQSVKQEREFKDNKNPVTGLLWEILAEKIYQKENAPIVRKPDDDVSVGHLETELSDKEVIYTSNGNIVEDITIESIKSGSLINEDVKDKTSVGMNEIKTKTFEVFTVPKDKTGFKTADNAQTSAKKTSYSIDSQSASYDHSKKTHKDITRRATGSKVKTVTKTLSQERIYDKKTYSTARNKSKGKLSGNTNRQFETQGHEKRRYVTCVREGKTKANTRTAIHSDKIYQQIVKTIGKQVKSKTLVGPLSKQKSPVSSVHDVRQKSPVSSDARFQKPKSPGSSELKVIKSKSPVSSEHGFTKSVAATLESYEVKRKSPTLSNDPGVLTSSPTSNEICSMESNRINSHNVPERQAMKTDHKSQVQSSSNHPPSNNLISVLNVGYENADIGDTSTRSEVSEVHVKSENKRIEKDEDLLLSDDQGEKHEERSNISPDRKTVEDGFTLIMSKNVNMKESRSGFNAILEGLLEKIPQISLNGANRVATLARKVTTNVDEPKPKPATSLQEIKNRGANDTDKNKVFSTPEVDDTLYIREVLKRIEELAVDNMYQKYLGDAREKTNEENNEKFATEKNEMNNSFLKDVGDGITTDKRTKESTITNAWEIIADHFGARISRKEAELKAKTVENESVLTNKMEEEDNEIIANANVSHNVPFNQEFESTDPTYTDTTGEMYSIVGDEDLQFEEEEDQDDEDICQLRAEIAEWIASNANINRKTEKIGGNTLDVLESVPEIVDMEIYQIADEAFTKTPNLLMNKQGGHSTVNEVPSITKRGSDEFVEAEEFLSQANIIDKIQKESLPKTTEATTLNQTNVNSTCPQSQFGTDSIAQFIGMSTKIQDEEMAALWRIICHKVRQARLIVARKSLQEVSPNNLSQDGEKSGDTTEFKDISGKDLTPPDPIVDTGTKQPGRRKTYIPCTCFGKQGSCSKPKKESNKDDNSKGQGQIKNTEVNTLSAVSGKENQTIPVPPEWDVPPKEADETVCYAVMLDLLNKTANKVTDLCHLQSLKTESYPDSANAAYAGSEAEDISNVLREIKDFNLHNKAPKTVSQDEENEEFYPTVESWEEPSNEEHVFKLQTENNDEMLHDSWGMDITNTESTKTIVESEKGAGSSDAKTDANEALLEQLRNTEESEIGITKAKTNSTTEIDTTDTLQNLTPIQYHPINLANGVNEPINTTGAGLTMRGRLLKTERISYADKQYKEEDDMDKDSQEGKGIFKTEEERRVAALLNAMNLELRSTADLSKGMTSHEVDAAMRRADEVIRRASDIEKKLTDVIRAASTGTYNQLMKRMSSSGNRRRRPCSPMSRRQGLEAGTTSTATNLLELLDHGLEEVDTSCRIPQRANASNSSVPAPPVTTPPSPSVARGASTDPDITLYCAAFTPTDFIDTTRNAVGDNVAGFETVRDAITETSLHALMVNDESDVTTDFPSDASDIYSDSAVESFSDSSDSSQSSSSTSPASWEGLTEANPPALTAFREHLERDGVRLEFTPVLVCPHRHSPAQRYRPRHRAAVTVLGVVAEASAVNEEVAKRRATLLLAAELARRQVDGRLPAQLTPFSDDELLQLAALARAEAGNEGAETWLRTECQRRRRSPPRFVMTAVCNNSIRFPGRSAGTTTTFLGFGTSTDAGEEPAFVVECRALDLHAFGSGAHRHTARRAAAQEMLDILEKQRPDPSSDPP